MFAQSPKTRNVSFQKSPDFKTTKLYQPKYNIKSSHDYTPSSLLNHNPTDSAISMQSPNQHGSLKDAGNSGFPPVSPDNQQTPR